MEISFRTPQSRRDVFNVLDFMSAQDLNYPGYRNWLDRSEPEIFRGQKQAILAYYENKLVGDLVFQQDKRCPFLIEIKNLRVHPGWRGRKFASFMLAQLEQEYAQGYAGIICDARLSERDIVNSMIRLGYQPVTNLRLYDADHSDIVLLKLLTKRNNKSIISTATDLARSRAIALTI